MKQRLFLACSLWMAFSICTGLAASLTPAEALKKAEAFRNSRQKTALRSSPTFRLVYQGQDAKLRSTDQQPPLYVFNIGENQGFVIVSGEESTQSILGYADEGSFRATDMPENLLRWMEWYESDIEQIRSNQNDSTVLTYTVEKAAESTSEQVTGTGVEPLTKNIKWNQADPFNLLCPWDSTAQKHAITGCVATAMGEVMMYYKWPIKGTDSKTYTEDDYGSLTANFGNTTYDWANMLESYGSGSTSQQDSAVATLLYHCGVSVSMDYSTSSSGASSDQAGISLVNYFGYDTDLQKYTRKFYTDAEWKSMIRKELDQYRPILYSGRTADGGHAFLCDGYDTSGLFHINWGWSGYSNGFFEITSLSSDKPDDYGAIDGYGRSQGMICGIQKPDGITQTTYQMGLYSKGLASSASSVSNIATKTIDLSFGFLNYGLNTYTGKMAIGYLKNEVWTILKEISISSLQSNYGYSDYTTGFKSISLSSLSAGTHTLYCLYKPTGATTWSIMKGTNSLNNALTIQITSTTATIQKPDSGPILSLSDAVKSQTKVYQGKSATFNATIQNAGPEFYSNLKLIIKSVTDTTLHQTVDEGVACCPTGETRTFHFSGNITLPAGDYHLIALYDSTNSSSTSHYKTLSPSVFGDTTVTILNTPGTPQLTLNNQMTLANGSMVEQQEELTLSANITNSGGYFDSRIIAFVFPASGGYSVAYLGPQTLYLDSLQTKPISLKGSLDLDPGDYFLGFYYYVNGWKAITPSSYAKIDFTLTPTGLKETTAATDAEPIVYQTENTLSVETAIPVLSLQVFDLAGRLIKQEQSTQTMDTGAFHTGIYLLRIETAEKVTIHRFLKK